MKETKRVKINPLSYRSIPISLYFDETNTKLASATGFIYSRNNKLYLITNWHNFTGLNPINKTRISNHGGVPDTVVLTLLTQEKPFMIWKNYPMKIYDNLRKADWFIHPVHKEKVDVVAIEIEVDEEFEGIFKPINEIDFDDFKLEVSDDIFVLGFPYSLKGGGNFPIWKKGSVASEPDIDYEDLPKFLIDTASRTGMSGSPVIFKRNGIHSKKNSSLGNLSLDSLIGEIQNFVGVYSGRILGKTELEAQLGIVWKKEVIDEIIDGEFKDEINMW